MVLYVRSDFGNSDPGGASYGSDRLNLSSIHQLSTFQDAHITDRPCVNHSITSKMTSRIVATSRQTRFNPLVQGDASEVDLNDVNISVGEREILVDGRIRLKGGMKYGLIGRSAFSSRFTTRVARQ